MEAINKLEKKLFEERGQVNEAVNSIITLIVGVGVAVLVLIFVGVLGGQTFELVEDDIDSISNDSIRDSIKNSILSGFTALEQTGDFLPIIVLAVIIFLVLSLVLGFTAFGGQGGVGGTAL